MASDLKESAGKPKKFECKLAGILESSSNLGLKQECTTEQPVLLRAHDIKLHYMMHYINAGEWDYVMPKERNDFSKIYGYRCNLCLKKFSNNYKTKSSAGRRLVLSHLADSHGLLLRTMKLEQRVDLAKDIEEIIACDEGFKKIMSEKANIDHLEPSEWITIMVSPDPLQDTATVKSLSNGNDVEKGHNPSKKRIEPNQTHKEVHEKLDPTNDIPSPKLINDLPEKSIIESQTEPNKKPSVIECPHCDEFKGNDSGSLLRLHIYTHYLQHWEHEMNKVKENLMICHLCNKRITGQNLEGTRRAVACHFAVQHFQLRKILEKETGLPRNFVSDLYRDFDERMKHSNIFTSSTKSNSIPKRRFTKKNDSYHSSEDSDFSSEARSKPKKKKCQSSTKSVVLPGEANPNYVRKRAKINFSLDDESEESDNSWDDTKIVAKVPPSSSKSRIMPKRSATKVWSFLDDSDDEL